MIIRNKPGRLKLIFLTPLCIGLITIILFLSFLIYNYHNQKINQALKVSEKQITQIYHESLDFNIRAMDAIAFLIQKRSSLEKNFINRDKTELFSNSLPVFEQLNKKFNITHFYYILPNKKVLLRVHAPNKNGDVINRFTLDKAIDKQEMSTGVEMGVLGTLTLRVVFPWFDSSKKLIGYIELGIEIDDFMENIQLFQNQSFSLTVFNKHFINKSTWANGMRALGRKPNWNQFSHIILNSTKKIKVPMVINQCLAHDPFNKLCAGLNNKNSIYKLVSLPIKSLDGKTIAKFLVLLNFQKSISSLNQLIYQEIILLIIFSIVIFISFYMFLNKLAFTIESTEKTLSKLAFHDGLTDLYNHVTYYELLDKEVKRANRYKTSLAVLFIDIDYFKKVNDTFGHLVGDIILKELASLLKGAVRDSDSVCRYGGEEFAIIMSGVSEEGAFAFAERLRYLVENKSFNKNREVIHITISIGIGFSLGKIDNVKTLTSLADESLYLAKKNGRNCVRCKEHNE